jgi:hypothetical protein
MDQLNRLPPATTPGQGTGRTLTFGLREAIVMALGGIAIAVAAALYLS